MADYVIQAAIKSENSLKIEWCKMTTILSPERLSGAASFKTAVDGNFVRLTIGVGPMYAYGEVLKAFAGVDGCEIDQRNTNKGSSIEVLISMASVQKISEALEGFHLMGSKKPCFENGSSQECATPSAALLMAFDHQ